jgi:UDP-N-acetylglucosamine--N-acetylmuramyl-(pentapeptide) pyrophosphoryl-undecaprenol N-acetylglucosamine transferase
MKEIKLLIAGGGTGGHLIPGIALYEAFQSRGIACAVLTGRNDLKSSALNDLKDGDVFSYGAKTLSWNIFKFLFFIISFVISFLKALFIIRNQKFSAVIGMGGYVSAPALVAGIILQVPIFLCEQNTVPGKVTLLFSGYAKNIFSTFEESAAYFKDDKKARIVCAGNPIRKNVMSPASREEAKSFFNLKHSKRVILIIGGSQGALQINELFMEIKKIYQDELKDVGVIWSTGSFSYKRFAKEIQESRWGGSIFMSPFIDKVGLAYRASDIAISRSGAGVIMELAAAGIPSILIPYPFAADNHQETNADVFHKAGAGVKFTGDDASPENIGKKMIEILNNGVLQARMSERALTIAKINASRDIADRVVMELS